MPSELSWLDGKQLSIHWRTIRREYRLLLPESTLLRSREWDLYIRRSVLGDNIRSGIPAQVCVRAEQSGQFPRPDRGVQHWVLCCLGAWTAVVVDRHAITGQGASSSRVRWRIQRRFHESEQHEGLPRLLSFEGNSSRP